MTPTIVVPHESVPSVLPAVEQRLAKEERTRARLKAGELTSFGNIDLPVS